MKNFFTLCIEEKQVSLWLSLKLSLKAKSLIKFLGGMEV
jgi:hypothetical protein